MSVSVCIGLFFLLAIVYANFLFPVTLLLLNKKRKPIQLNSSDSFEPTVTILMAVYNEEKIIREKIESVFNSNYNRSKIQFLIGSDNSTDQTHKIVNEFIENGYPVELVVFKDRQGKPNIINQLHTKSNGDIYILTDANVLFSKSTINELVKYFYDPKTGVVGASFQNYNLKKEGISNQENLYIDLESKIKIAESNLYGKMVGAFGGCFATKAEDYLKVPTNLVLDDFYVSMSIFYENKVSILNPKAIVFEDLPNKLNDEFSRKVRMTVGNFQNLFCLKEKLFSLSFNSFLFWSHKGLRWLTPLLFLSSFVLLLPLILQDKTASKIALITLGTFTLIPLIERFFYKLHIHLPKFRVISYFILMNFAVLMGTFKYMFGVKNHIWKPTERLN